MRKEIEEKLAVLPIDPDEIAAKFKELGIVGSPGSILHCPVAEYLFPDGGGHVGPTSCRIYNRSHSVDDVGIILPKHISVFIHQFDGLSYPDLVKPVTMN